MLCSHLGQNMNQGERFRKHRLSTTLGRSFELGHSATSVRLEFPHHVQGASIWLLTRLLGNVSELQLSFEPLLRQLVPAVH